MANRNLTDVLDGEDTVTVEDIASGLFTNDEGVPYTDLLAVGANPTAKIYRDGTVVGSTDNGEYTREANGNITLTRTFSAQASGFTGWVYPIVVTSTTGKSGASVVSNTTSPIVAKFSNPSTSGVDVAAATNTSTAATFVATTLQLIVIGKWK